MKVKSLSRVWLFVTPWTVAHQAPLSIEFSRQESWSGLPFLPLGDIPNPGIEPRVSRIAVRHFTVWATREAHWVKWVKLLSRVQLLATLWTVAHQAPPSTGFSRQEYWSGLPFPSPGNAEYIMWNAGLDESQAGIKIAGRSIINLRYTDDTTLMVESEEELKSLLMRGKEETEKVSLKLNIQNT